MFGHLSLDLIIILIIMGLMNISLLQFTHVPWIDCLGSCKFNPYLLSKPLHKILYKKLLNCFVLDHNVFKNLTYFALHYHVIEIFAADLIAD